MQSTSHSSVAGFCKSLFYCKLKITALDIVTYLNFYFVSYSMEIQSCRNKGIIDVGFMDPLQINEKNVRDEAAETLENLFKFLDRQHSKSCILLPYNCK